MSAKQTRALQDGFFLVFVCTLVYFLAGRLDLLERFVAFSMVHEAYELDELVTTAVALALCMIFFSYRRLAEARRAHSELEARNTDLEKAMEEIRQLRGIIPICSYCKNVRSDDGFWQKVELYVESHSQAEFSHGICPDCLRKYYPDFQNEEETD